MTIRGTSGNPTSTRIRYRTNGTGHAFLRELGHACPRCSTAERNAQTSGSLLIEQMTGNASAIQFHILFDCGLGVVDSLIEAGIDTLTHVFISHNHPDHILELDRLLQSHLRSAARNKIEARVPCYCTAGTRRTGPDKHFPYLNWDRIDVIPGMPVRPLQYLGSGTYGNAGLGIDLQITPVRVYHGNIDIVPDPVIWVVEFNATAGRVKIVLGWDFLHFVPRYANEDHDDKYTGPVTEVMHPSHEILGGADLLVLAGNTLEPHPNTGHTSIDALLRFTIPFLQPKGETWIVHYSGHEDTAGPLSRQALEQDINEKRREHKVDPNLVIVEARPGWEWQWYY